MGVITTSVMVGAAVLTAGMGYMANQQQADRADDQSKLAGNQAQMELRRSSMKAEEAMRDLEDAKTYQKWKEDYVVPVLQKSLSNPIKSDPAQLRAKAGLAVGIQSEAARKAVMQGISAGGFDLGGARYDAANADISQQAVGAQSMQTAAGHEMVRDQGIVNTGALVNAGRQVYKQEGII